MTRECIGHGGTVPDDEAVIVGAVEAGTCGGRFLYACPPCVALYGLVPYDEHPADSDGQPRRRQSDGTPGTRPFIGVRPSP